MPEPDDLQLLLDAAHQAGEIAKRHFRNNPRSWDKGGGQGPVTEADIEIDAMLSDMLQSARPDYGWLSEESDDSAERLTRDQVFIVDPIDGTRAFADGRETFSHSLAVARDGRVTAAVIHLPLRGKTYAAAIGAGATLNGAPIGVGENGDLARADILAGKWNVDPKHWQGGKVEFKRHIRPSLAYRLGLVAQGRFDGMITLRQTWEWDVAAGALIVEEAGGCVTDWGGNAPRFNNERPMLDGMIAAGQPMHRRIFERLAPRDQTTRGQG